MAANREQKRRQQAALRRAVQIIRTEHPDLWAAAYQQAREEAAARETAVRTVAAIMTAALKRA